jgi:hypothetical protein
MHYQQQSFICLIRLRNFWSLHIHEMAEGYKENMWERNWPLNNLSTNSTSACRQEREREKQYIHMHSRRTTEKMDERTNGSTTNSHSFSSCYMCIDTLIAREGERVIGAESLYGSIQHTNSFSSFFLTSCSTTASRRFCSSSTELRVLLFFLHYRSRHCQQQVSQHTHTYIHTCIVAMKV